METVNELMSTDVYCTTPEASLYDVARLMVEANCGEIPLVNDMEDKKVIGVITDRDIVCRSLGVGKDPGSLTAGDCMSTPVITCSFDASIDECASLMEDNQIRRIPIVDEDDCLCGMVSLADIAEFGDEEETLDVIKRVSEPTDSASGISTGVH